jgi:hypothetical protein
MPHKIYFINTEKKEKLELCWKGSFQNFTLKLDNNELGVIKTRKELKEGREFVIGYNKKLEIRLVMQLGIFPCIEILFNDKPVPGTMTDPKKQLSNIFYFMLFIAILYIISGLAGLISDIQAFSDHGIGLNSIIYGVLFIMMGLVINKRHSMFALIAVISLLGLDIIFVLIRIAEYGVKSNPWPTIVIKMLFMLYLCKGFSAIMRLRQLRLMEMEKERINSEKKQRTPISEQKTEDHTLFMPEDHSGYLPDE